MDKSEISKVRDELISANPDLPKEQLTDERLEAALVKVSSDAKRVEPGADKADLQEPIYADQSATVKSTSNLSNLEPVLQPGIGKETMTAILQALAGDSNDFTFNDKNLAANVGTFLGLPKKE